MSCAKSSGRYRRGSSATALARNRLQNEVVGVVDELGDQVGGGVVAGSQRDPVPLVQVAALSDPGVALAQQPPVLRLRLEGDDAFVRVVGDDQEDLARDLVDGRPWLTPGSAKAAARAVS
jgi:hypothetical protein